MPQLKFVLGKRAIELLCKKKVNTKYSIRTHNICKLQYFKWADYAYQKCALCVRVCVFVCLNKIGGNWDGSSSHCVCTPHEIQKVKSKQQESKRTNSQRYFLHALIPRWRKKEKKNRIGCAVSLAIWSNMLQWRRIRCQQQQQQRRSLKEKTCMKRMATKRKKSNVRTHTVSLCLNNAQTTCEPKKNAIFFSRVTFTFLLLRPYHKHLSSAQHSFFCLSHSRFFFVCPPHSFCGISIYSKCVHICVSFTFTPSIQL